MIAHAKANGHSVYFDESTRMWRYTVDDRIVDFEKERTCRACDKFPELLKVPMMAHLSYTGKARQAIKGVDACIAPIVNALNAAGIKTASSCCGHQEAPGWIALHDGRTLNIEGQQA